MGGGVNKPKAQGTANETRRVGVHQWAGLSADRLSEGGRYDPGDVWIVAHPGDDPDEVGWIDECKARANLNPHQTLAKALAKAGHMRVMVSHKRLVRKDGNQRRTPDGEVEVVSFHPATAEALLCAYEHLRKLAPSLTAKIWKDVA